jgi:hypothetical protein
VLTSTTVVSNGRITKTTPSGKSSKKNDLKQEAIEKSFGSVMDDGFADIDSMHDGLGLGLGLGALDFETSMASTNFLD